MRRVGARLRQCVGYTLDGMYKSALNPWPCLFLVVLFQGLTFLADSYFLPEIGQCDE
jgi:hypothetical protein